jgi:hypothetical protein
LFDSSEFNRAEPETNTMINTGKMIHETIVLKEQPNKNARMANENWIKIRESCCWVIIDIETYIQLEV